MKRRFPLSTFYSILLLFLTAPMMGCGNTSADGPQRFRVTGKVTYDGQPLQFGSITFEPDISKGNSGPQGSAEIRDGQFDTRRSKGVVGGPMVVSIQGTTHENVTEGGEGRFLFSNFTLEKDLPRENTTLDVDVPREVAAMNSKK